jgi:putative two-component system response regulator
VAGPENLLGARVLIVDDEAANVELLRHVLEPVGYKNLITTTDPRQVADLCRQFPPDIVLLDLRMPSLDGFQVLEQLPDLVADFEHLPVLVLTSDTQNTLLERKVRQRTADLEEAQFEIVERLALAAEYRDDETGKHTKRVGILSAKLAKEFGWPESQVEVIRRAAPMHDVGKIGIDSAVLLKPGKLTTEEFDHIKEHVTIGHGILSGSRFSMLQMAAEIALYHHENWDGTGYQAGLKGEAIPESARIVTVIDVFDSLTHKRPYKEAWPVEKALEEITSLRRTKFDPRVLDAFFTLYERGETEGFTEETVARREVEPAGAPAGS